MFDTLFMRTVSFCLKISRRPVDISSAAWWMGFLVVGCGTFFFTFLKGKIKSLILLFYKPSTLLYIKIFCKILTLSVRDVETVVDVVRVGAVVDGCWYKYGTFFLTFLIFINTYFRYYYCTVPTTYLIMLCIRLTCGVVT